MKKNKKSIVVEESPCPSDPVLEAMRKAAREEAKKEILTSNNITIMTVIGDPDGWRWGPGSTSYEPELPFLKKNETRRYLLIEIS